MVKRPATYASLTYAVRAATYALNHLANDERVLQWWMAWCAMRGLTPDVLQRWRTVVMNNGGPVPLDGIVNAATDESIRAFQAVCRDEPGLSYDWLPSVLLDCFRLWVYDIVEGRLASGDERCLLAFKLGDEWDGWDGTIPADKGDRCARDVVWWYRARVKQPPEVIDAIEREVSAASANGKRTATVNHAIKRVEHALASLSADDLGTLRARLLANRPH